MMSICQPAPLRLTMTLLAICCGLLIGIPACAPKNPPVDAQMTPADQVAALRESIQKSKPGSLVGQVLTTYEQYAAVTDIPTKEVAIGQTISFLDAKGDPINNGTIARIIDDTLHVKFDTNGKRPVQKGDIAVLLKD